MTRAVRSRAILLMLVASVLVCLLQCQYYFKNQAVWRMTGEFSNANWRQLSEEQVNKLSVLGRMLFLGETQGLEPQKTNFTILVWKFGPQLERRHIHRFDLGTFDPFAECSVTNCRLTYLDSDLATADAVLFHLHRTPGRHMLPTWPRPPNQRWVFLTDESPYNTFMFGHPYNTVGRYNGLFNWSMTYRMDADVPVPYGRTIFLSDSERQKGNILLQHNYASGKSGLVAILSSACFGTNGRWNFVVELQKYINVDVFGACGLLKCPGHFGRDCPFLNKYKFYLALENSNCRDYVTEKAWWNAYEKGAVPVVMGASRENYKQLLPPHSYIHTDDFASPKELAQFLLHLNNSDEEYNFYFNWKRHFKVVNEHGYFQSPVFHYCRLCEALNYNDRAPKMYKHLQKYWSVETDCYTKN